MFPLLLVGHVTIDDDLETSHDFQRATTWVTVDIQLPEDVITIVHNFSPVSKPSILPLLVMLKTFPFIRRSNVHSVALNFLFRAWMLPVILNELASQVTAVIQASEGLTSLSLVPFQ
ncbi:hypothetical protein OBBRIDRAFT_889502 [Obba rivulosa]|uniref:Uncharacterized protein n=1 Tax=Obba rivulosa TaxID=1052685 RepID=A0A8E2AYP8_9APHY|nr:hypothetical protein OBBRIDRAFT_889502 [Obba rivulosa]